MISPTVAIAMLVAVIGWLATIRAISTSRLSSRNKRWMLLPSWIPWMALALGAPILSGFLALSEALHIGSAITIGLMVSVVVAGRQSRRQ